MNRRAGLIPMIGAATILLGGCGAAPQPASGSPLAATGPTPSTQGPSRAPGSTEPWTTDLETLDRSVRTIHPSPFTIHTEAEWTAKLSEIRATLPGATPDEQLVQLASLVGLLDTHSYLQSARPATFYEVVIYPFADGLHAIRAADASLVGARLKSIGGVSADDVQARLAPLVPHDNPSGLLDGIEGLLSSVEYLHGTGIVTDPGKPQYAFERANGQQITLDPGALEQSAWEGRFNIVGDLLGEAPEAVARRTESVWWRLEAARRVFLISYNDYVDPSEALQAMATALDGKKADRVVLDLRYLRGGNGSIAFPLVEGLAADTRVNRAGGLTVLIGRENVSAGTVIDRMLDEQTQALFVGESTPARADNFLCECMDVRLPASGFVVGLPTFTFKTGDARSEIAPDVPMSLSAADFFAGRDPVLEAALEGLPVPTAS